VRVDPFGKNHRTDEEVTFVITEPNRSNRERNPIASIVRVLGAMVEAEGASFGVRELARMLDTPPSSVQRTLLSGADVSLVTPSASGQWELGWELYRIASLAQRKQPFQVAGSVLNELSEMTGETAVLAVYDHPRRARMYVATSPSRRSVRFVPDLFKWLPLHAAASAMAILAFRSFEERTQLFEEGFPIFAGVRPTPTKIEELYTSIRSDGYALSRDQADVGASAIAAPIKTAACVESSIAITVPNQRFDEANAPELERRVLWAAEVLGQRLGHPLASLDSATGTG
jgi:IclR family transcriptional regulator, acetate operon repressor